MAPEGHDKGRACGDQHEHTRALDAIQREFNQFESRRIDPMRVLDHPKHRLIAGKPCQLVDEDGECAVAALLGWQGERAVTRFSLEPNERRHQRGNLADIAAGLGQQRLQQVQAALRRVVLGKADGLSDLLDRGVERAVDMIGRTLVAQQKMRFAAQCIHQGFGDPRLADPSLAAEQDHLTFTALGLPPALDQKGEFLVAGYDR